MKELFALIGKVYNWYPENSISVACVINDVKMAWGDVRIQIKPIAGDGSLWVKYHEDNLVKE